LTEVFHNRVVLPFTGSYEDLRHVVAHELTHAYLFDRFHGGSASRMLARQTFFSAPLWFAEGLAENGTPMLATVLSSVGVGARSDRGFLVVMLDATWRIDLAQFGHPHREFSIGPGLRPPPVGRSAGLPIDCDRSPRPDRTPTPRPHGTPWTSSPD
jgi:hypothetical protein